VELLEEVKARLSQAVPVPGAEVEVEVIPNPAVPAQSSLKVAPAHILGVARCLRDAAGLRFDFCSNATGVDWPARTESVKVRRIVDGVETEVAETRQHPGFLEAVYHLYSVELRQGPLILRQRTADRAAGASLVSLTPVWRSCEFQEREIFDLFGIRFEGHPDLRRILMWDGFQDHPMRKDYHPPDDYEYEPTPHGGVIEKAQRHATAREAAT